MRLLNAILLVAMALNLTSVVWSITPDNEPNFDDLPGEVVFTDIDRTALGAPIHSPLGKTLTNTAATAAGGTGGRALGAGIGAAIAKFFGFAARSKVAARCFNIGGLAGAGVLGLAVNAGMQYFTQGKVDWGTLLASTGGAVVALALMNPGSFVGTVAVAALGSLLGELVLKGIKSKRKEVRQGWPYKKSTPGAVRSE